MPDSPQPKRTSASLIVSVLGAGFVAGMVPAGLLPANVPHIEQAYGLSHTEMGRLVGLCMFFGGGIGGLMGGWVCGRIGALRNLVLSMVLAACALACVGLADGLLFAVGGLAGFFFAQGFMGSSNALATKMLPDRQRGVALLHAINATGKLGGPVLAAIFVAGVWRNSFLAAAVLPALLIIPTVLARRSGDISIGKKPDGGGRPGVFFWMAIAGFSFIAGSEIAVALWIPAYAQEVRGLSLGEGKLLLAMFLVGLTTGRFASSAASKAVSARLAIAVCGCATVFVVPSLALPAFVPSALCFILFGAAYSATWPSYFTHISRVFPDHLGLAGGAAVFASVTGFAICSAISGRLAEMHISYPIVFGAVLMALFVVVFFVSPLARAGKGVQKA